MWHDEGQWKANPLTIQQCGWNQLPRPTTRKLRGENIWFLAVVGTHAWLTGSDMLHYLICWHSMNKSNSKKPWHSEIQGRCVLSIDWALFYWCSSESIRAAALENTKTRRHRGLLFTTFTVLAVLENRSSSVSLLSDCSSNTRVCRRDSGQ